MGTGDGRGIGVGVGFGIGRALGAGVGHDARVLGAGVGRTDGAVVGRGDGWALGRSVGIGGTPHDAVTVPSLPQWYMSRPSPRGVFQQSSAGSPVSWPQ